MSWEYMRMLDKPSEWDPSDAFNGMSQICYVHVADELGVTIGYLDSAVGRSMQIYESLWWAKSGSWNLTLDRLISSMLFTGGIKDVQRYHGIFQNILILSFRGIIRWGPRFKLSTRQISDLLRSNLFLRQSAFRASQSSVAPYSSSITRISTTSGGQRMALCIEYVILGRREWGNRLEAPHFPYW